jgi:alkylhydroperoxidase/carboxymuconolactone decarboxylase family protein YurZ
MGDVSEIAGLVSYLASEEAGFITGASLTIDGGLTLKEIEEVLIQALPYVGYFAIATALAAAAEVIKEHGLDVDKNYAGHRGLL